MDWTGGTRRRYAAKGKHDEVLQKQKAHFARVRAAAESQAFAYKSKQYQPPMSSHEQADVDHRHTVTRPSNSRLGSAASDRRQTRDSASKLQRHRHIDRANSSSSRRFSLKHDKAAKRVRQNIVLAQGQPDDMTEEEQLLLANRERLLARTDWLGLAASRPVPYRFPSSRDKDRIAKRRRVHKSRHDQAQPKERTPVSSVFGQKLAHNNQLMRRALPQESINIMIGTDAFASQTQPSQHHRTPVNTSLRPPSTDLEPIPEQPMLVRVDEDGFERHGLPESVGNSRMDTNPTMPVLPARATDIVYDDVDTQDAFSLYHHISTIPLNDELIPDDDSFEDLDAEQDLDWLPTSRPTPSTTDAQGHEIQVQGRYRPREASLDLSGDETDELIRRYRKVISSELQDMNVQPSSLHATQATTERRFSEHDPPHLGHQSRHDRLYPDYRRIDERRDRSFAVQDREGHLEDDADSTADLFAPQQNTSARPRDTQAATTLPDSPSAGQRLTNEADENAMWRQFIIGSQASDSDVSEPTNKSRMDLWQLTDPVQPACSTPSGELARTDRATVGVTELFEEEQTQPLLSETAANSSMVAQATSIHPATEEADSDRLSGHRATDADQISFTTGNIHASSVVVTRNRARSHGRRRPTRTAGTRDLE